MARRAIISRTMSNTHVKYMWVDITSGKTGTEETTLFGKIPARDTALRKLRKKLDTETFKVVAVLEYYIFQELRAQYAEVFFENSFTMPLRSAGKEG